MSDIQLNVSQMARKQLGNIVGKKVGDFSLLIRLNGNDARNLSMSKSGGSQLSDSPASRKSHSSPSRGEQGTSI
jgi:hypothetical protein